MSVLSGVAGVLECQVQGEDRPGYYDRLGEDRPGYYDRLGEDRPGYYDRLVRTRTSRVKTEEGNVVFSEQEETIPSRDVYMC